MVEQRRAPSTLARVGVFILVFFAVLVALIFVETALGISSDGVSGSGAVVRAFNGIVGIAAAVVAVRRMGR